MCSVGYLQAPVSKFIPRKAGRRLTELAPAPAVVVAATAAAAKGSGKERLKMEAGRRILAAYRPVTSGVAT